MKNLLKRLARKIVPARPVHVMIDRPLMLRYAAKTVDPDGVFIDVGAGTGTTARQFAELANLKPENCHLIEPEPANFAVMQRNAPGYVAVQAAIASRSGAVTIYSVDDPRWEGSSKSNTIYRDVLKEKFNDQLIVAHEIPAVTIGDYLRNNSIERVECLFFNCEGAEYELFDSDLDWLDRTRLLWIDLHGRSETLLRRHGDRRTGIYDKIVARGMTRVGGHRREDTLNARYHLSFLFERLDWPQKSS
jgi:FkbM family methyltransferase